jgi:hypothetical protein
MTTQKIAHRLVELCRQGQHDQAYQELFAENAVAVEPARYNVPDTVGLPALLEKSKKWAEDLVEVHDASVSNPIVAGDYFTVSMELDLTTKSNGRSQMEEICLYEVQNGKIVKEQFFY